jgi:hypothetical protein
VTKLPLLEDFMFTKRFSVVIILIGLFWTGNVPFQNPGRFSTCHAQALQTAAMTSQQATEYQKLTEEQKRAIQSEMARSGGGL